MPAAIPALSALSKHFKCDPVQIEKGTKFSRISYGTIVQASRHEITVRNEEGKEWTITPELVAAEFYTPDQYLDVQELSRTEMVKAIVGNPHIVMTVNFNKQADAKDLRTAVTELLDDERAGRTRLGPRKLANFLKAATTGQERTLVGRHYGKADEFGRIQFVDMEVESGHNLRQVDPRTVQWAIFGNVKYVLKP
jgi:hypothetical protein